ncbi:MAG: hypothetical protein ACLPVO_17440 [Desulfomonilaceae bacterium]
MKDKLKIGILIDSYQIPNWAFKMLERIDGSTYAEIVLIVKNDAPTPSENVYRKLKDNYQILLFIALMRLDNVVFRSEPNAFEAKEIRQLLPNTPYMTVNPIQNKFSDCFEEDDIERIESYHIDVLVKLGFRILSGKVLTSARYGVWSYNHSDNEIDQGKVAGFWEVLEEVGETGSFLEILTEDFDHRKILCRSYSQTDHLSVNRNRNNLFWKTLSFLPRKLKELYEVGEQEFYSTIRKDNQHPYTYSKRLYSAPRNAELISLAFRHYSKYILKTIRSFFYFEQWILLYDINKSDRFSWSFWRFKKIIPPKDRFWGDPFIIYKNNQYYVFIEELLFQRNEGHISYFTIDEDGNSSVPKKIIKKPYHLSYPFVFSYNNEFYMIPETGSNRTIELYKCLEFPEEWKMAEILMKNVRAYDTTILHKDGKWWLFTNICENKGGSHIDELFLFYSTDLFSGNWTPHPKNPIVSDVKSSRSAGRIFSYDGNIYRPSQNSFGIYGFGIKINHIVMLTETEYKEECVSDIEPLWDKRIIAIHTLDFVKNLTVVDAKLERAKYL